MRFTYKLAFILVAVLFGGIFACCGGLVLIGALSAPLTPEQRAELDRKQHEWKAERDLERQEAARRDSVAAEQRKREEAKADRKQARSSAEREEGASAISAAKSLVTKRLSHPSTASFGWFPESNKNSNGTWTVTGTVKAKNDFNLELEYDYRCVLKLDGNTWQLVDCDLAESQ